MTDDVQASYRFAIQKNDPNVQHRTVTNLTELNFVRHLSKNFLNAIFDQNDTGLESEKSLELRVI